MHAWVWVEAVYSVSLVQITVFRSILIALDLQFILKSGSVMLYGAGITNNDLGFFFLKLIISVCIWLDVVHVSVYVCM